MSEIVAMKIAPSGCPRDRPAPAGHRVAPDERRCDRVVGVAPGEEQGGIRARCADQDPRACRVERGDPERADGEERDRQGRCPGGDAVLAEQVDLTPESRAAHHHREDDRDHDEDVDGGGKAEHGLPEVLPARLVGGRDDALAVREPDGHALHQARGADRDDDRVGAPGADRESLRRRRSRGRAATSR